MTLHPDNKQPSPITDAQELMAEDVLDAIARVCAIGGSIYVGAVDRLNPRCGYSARATWPNGSAFVGGDTVDDALRALAIALQGAA